MAFPWLAAAGIGANIFGSILGHHSAKKAADMSVQAAYKAGEWNEYTAAKNRAWQHDEAILANERNVANATTQWNRSQQAATEQWERSQQAATTQFERNKYMSATAHQREIADLRAAGLNPILTATGGQGAPIGASAMAAAQAAQAGSTPGAPMGNGAQGFMPTANFSSAAQLKAASIQALTGAATQLMQQEHETKMQKRELGMKGQQLEWDKESFLKELELKNKQFVVDKGVSEAKAKLLTAQEVTETTRNKFVSAQIGSEEARINLLKAQEALTNLEAEEKAVYAKNAQRIIDADINNKETQAFLNSNNWRANTYNNIKSQIDRMDANGKATVEAGKKLYNDLKNWSIAAGKKTFEFIKDNATREKAEQMFKAMDIIYTQR